MLTKKIIEKGFNALNEQLKQKNLIGDVAIFGGAYMVIVMDARPSTKDIDAIFKPPSEIRKAVEDIADSLDLPNNWLNDGVKGFLSSKNEQSEKFLNLSNLRIWCPKPEYILAMKCMASRPETHDKEDILFLIAHLNITSADQVFDIVSDYYPLQKIPVTTQYFVEEIFEDLK